MDGPRPAGAKELEARSGTSGLHGARRLDVQVAAVADDPAGGRQGRGEQGRLERRVQEDEVEGAGRRRAIHCNASPRSTRTASADSRVLVARRLAAAAGSRSSRTTSAAPRDAASKPSAPEPAKASRQRHPGSDWPSQLKTVSRTRSGVGLRPGRSTTGRRVRFQAPPMIRTSRGRAGDAAFAGRGRPFAAGPSRPPFTAGPGCRRGRAAPSPRAP